MTRENVDLVAVDVGGTHVRFACASVGDRIELGEATTLATREYPSLGAAWAAYAGAQVDPLPRAAAIAVAAPVDADIVYLTNNSWTIERESLGATLDVERYVLLNDFEAVAHAVAVASPEAFAPLTGPHRASTSEGSVSVVGPGTGLGVAQIVRHGDALAVVATEGGHIGFAPATRFDDRLLEHLRNRHGRVSVERVVAGPGLRAVVEVLTGAPSADEDAALWQRALGGRDAVHRDALDHFCRLLGAVAGDIALAQGAGEVVIAGGLGLRLCKVLPQSSFAAGFTDKGRFAAKMRAIPVSVITHPQPGLLGAAAAFAREFAT